jgi:CRP/FNR family transcriptional regulator
MVESPIDELRAGLMRLPRAQVIKSLGLGKLVYQPGEPSDSIFLVQRGQIKISIVGPGGKHCILDILNPGSIFGEGSLAGEAVRQTVAEVVVEAALVIIPAGEVLTYAKDNPAFWRWLASHQAARVQRMERQLRWLCLLEVEQRLAELLLDWASQEKTALLAGEPVTFVLRQKDLAGLVGATRETTSAALNRLRRDRCIEIHRRQVTVLSTERLAAHAGPASPKLSLGARRASLGRDTAPSPGGAPRKREKATSAG